MVNSSINFINLFNCNKSHLPLKMKFKMKTKVTIYFYFYLILNRTFLLNSIEYQVFCFF